MKKITSGLQCKQALDDLTPDRLYQRNWAHAVLELTLTNLRDDYEADGKGKLFNGLRAFLGFGITEDMGSYRKAAESLGMQEGAVRTAVSRLRSRFRERLFSSVAATLANEDEDEIKAELRELLQYS